MKRSKKPPRGTYKRGDIWWIRYVDEFGNEVRESTAQSSLEAAKKILAKRKTEVAMRKHFPNLQYEKTTFDELLDLWWDRHGKNTSSKFQYQLPEIRGRFGHLKAREITPEMISDYLTERERDGLSASSLNHRRTLMNSTFNFAIRWKRFDENPVAAVPTFKQPPGRDRVVTPEEFGRILEACDARGYQELRTLIVTLILTTLRKGEVLSRRWNEVFLDDPIPLVYVPTTKNSDPKSIPLVPIVVEEIKKLPSFGESEYLFPSRPTARWPNPQRPYRWDFGKEWQAVLKDAEVQDLTLHDLRHFGPSVSLLEVPEDAMRKVTGHRGRELQRYRNASLKQKQFVVNLIAEKLFGQ